MAEHLQNLWLLVQRVLWLPSNRSWDWSAHVVATSLPGCTMLGCAYTAIFHLQRCPAWTRLSDRPHKVDAAFCKCSEHSKHHACNCQACANQPPLTLVVRSCQLLMHRQTAKDALIFCPLYRNKGKGAVHICRMAHSCFVHHKGKQCSPGSQI